MMSPLNTISPYHTQWLKCDDLLAGYARELFLPQICQKYHIDYNSNANATPRPLGIILQELLAYCQFDVACADVNAFAYHGYVADVFHQQHPGNLRKETPIIGRFDTPATSSLTLICPG